MSLLLYKDISRYMPYQNKLNSCVFCSSFLKKCFMPNPNSMICSPNHIKIGHSARKTTLFDTVSPKLGEIIFSHL